MSHCENSTYAPALELPYELTSQILINCLPFTAVSVQTEKWRAVALATRELWSSIHLEFRAGDPYNGIPTLFALADAEPVEDHTCDLLEWWLTRAANYPVSITLDGSVGLPEGVLAILGMHSARWRRIEIKVTKQELLEFNTIPGPFPSLRALAIRLTQYHHSCPVINAATSPRIPLAFGALSKPTHNRHPLPPHVDLRTCLWEVPSLETLKLLFPAAGVPSIDTRYRFLHHGDLLPHLRTLVIKDTLHIATYTPFLTVLHTRRGLARAELHMESVHAHVRTHFEASVAEGLSIRATTPTYTWPRDFQDEDQDAFGDLAFSGRIHMPPTSVLYDTSELSTEMFAG
ncbi:hypothetical protein B0H17DRAFT_1335698 [Mycena rosella]|uniref:F-box domain-containing protein n=1 Tax=Mycena rosella TaxID=1033263 RepID=A0AAD7G9G4_MYCRO|nr:hypothetical protein B0H17DRAFT_1335698 [Mycena rosella]